MRNKLLFLIVFILCILFSREALAGSLVISDELQEIHLSPGGAKHFSIVVKNESDKDLAVEVRVQGFKASEDGRSVELMYDINNPLASIWLKPLNMDDIILRPGDKKRAIFSMVVPQIAENGGYYAAIYFVGNDINSSEEYRSNNDLVLLGVESKDNNIHLRNGKIKKFSFPDFLYYGPMNFSVEFENNGKIHYKTRGEIEVYNSFNKIIKSIKIEEKNVFPDSSILLKSNWDRKYFFGRYVVVARMIDGDGNTTFISNKFWAIPWKELVVLFIIIILLLLANKVRGKNLSFE